MSAPVCMINNDLKYVTFDEARFFYTKYYYQLTDYEYINYISHKTFSFTFKLNMQNEIMQYWFNKGFTKGFSNMSLIFNP